MYSTNQIHFCHIRLPSIKCHFLINNLHFITYSNHIIQPTAKNSHETKCYWWWIFQAIFPRFLLFPQMKSTIGCLGFNLIACYFLVNNLHFIIFSPTRPARFSFTFEVEGHCLVSRHVHCEIEGRRPEPLGGSGSCSPGKLLKLKSPRSAFSCNLVKKSSWNDAYLI